MAVEARRGCGYRKIGGLYLVAPAGGFSCDRLPFLLDACPCCGGEIKQSRGFAWIDVGQLVGSRHADCREVDTSCPLCYHPERIGRAGLLWVGESFYKRPSDFSREALVMGISRRIAAIPRGFQVGRTWIILAHPKAFCGATELKLQDGRFVQAAKQLPGIFYAFIPTRIESLLPESARGTDAESALRSRGVTIVWVPDDDPDHRGTVYDD